MHRRLRNLAVHALTLALPLAAAAGAQDLGDFTLGAPPTSGAGARAERDAGLRAEVLVADSGQAAVDAAVAKLRSQGTGAHWIEVESGLGVVAAGEASYLRRPGERSDMVLLAQRFAWREAFLGARSEMLSFLKGMDVQSRQRFVERFQRVDGPDDSATNLETELEQRFEANVGGLLRGAVVYAVDDSPEEARVRVSIVATPRTMARVQQVDARVQATDDLELARGLLVAEIKRGVVPPEGGRVLTHPSLGTVWIGYGCALAGSHDEPWMERELRDQAEKRARNGARSSLLAVLQGEDVRVSETSGEGWERLHQEFEEHLDGCGGSSVELFDAARRREVYRSESETVIETLTQGQLPTGVEMETFGDEGGRWMHAIAMWREAGPTAIGAAPGGEAAAPAPGASACEQGGARAGCKRVLALGSGISRRAALLDALSVAVWQVNGGKFDEKSIHRLKFENALEDLDGELSRFTRVERGQQVDTEACSHGVVACFTVLEERAQEDGGTRVELCVDVYDYDPANPRPGMRPTIAVLAPPSPGSVRVDGRAVDPKAATGDLQSRVIAELLESRRYTVLDRTHAAAVDAELARLRARTADGTMAPSELAKLGRQLSADLLLVLSLERLEHHQWEEYVQARRTHERREQLSVALKASLVDVATGTLRDEAPIDRAWDRRDLGAREGRFRAMDPVGFACAQAALAVREAFAAPDAGSDSSEEWRVLDVAGRSTVVLAGVGLEVGDALDVLAIETYEDGGELYEDVSRIARLEVVSVNPEGRTARARIVEDELGTVAKGMTCRRAR